MDERIRKNFMISYNHVYDNVLSYDNRIKAIRAARLSKHRKRYFVDEQKSAENLIDWIVNYENAEHTPIEIYDGIGRKKRTIIVPTYKELAVQHALINAMKPIFMRGMYEHSYASIPGRGAHKAKKFVEKWIRKDARNCKYVLKMDIHHFFDSIPHDILKDMFQKTIHDEKLLELIFKIIDVNDKGLPLGFYTSQWFANWYLQGLDHYIKEQLGAKHYIRYMDDMVIFGSNKRELHQFRKEIAIYLNRLGLKLKGNWQVFRFDYIRKGERRGRDLDFMGFRFFRDRTTLRKRIMLKATRKALRIHKKGRANIHDIRQVLSYVGWLGCTDTYNVYLLRVKPFVNIQQYKRRVSRYDKRKKEEASNGSNLHETRGLSSNNAA